MNIVSTRQKKNKSTVNVSLICTPCALAKSPDKWGYRIYRTNAGFDLSSNLDILESLVTVAEFDSADNNIGYDTGFPAFIHLDEPMTFPGDTVEYKYKFEIDNLLNGWQYLFTVTAFDRGDEENGLPSLESSSLSSLNRILPGTPATSDDDVKIGVYPNPYYARRSSRRDLPFAYRRSLL